MPFGIDFWSHDFYKFIQRYCREVHFDESEILATPIASLSISFKLACMTDEFKIIQLLFHQFTDEIPTVIEVQ